MLKRNTFNEDRKGNNVQYPEFKQSFIKKNDQTNSDSLDFNFHLNEFANKCAIQKQILRKWSHSACNLSQSALALLLSLRVFGYITKHMGMLSVHRCF